MNTLINSEQPHYIQEAEENETEIQTAGEVFAIALVSFLVASFFIVSSWSAVLLLTGNTAGGGPIGLVFNLIRTTGIV